MADTACKHRNITHTDSWPPGGVGGVPLFPAVDRCDDCGNEVTETTDDKGVSSWQ